MIIGLILLAGMLGLTGYLLRVRASQNSRLDDLERKLNSAHSRAIEPARIRNLRVEFHVNRFLQDFPGRQAYAAADLIARIGRLQGWPDLPEFSVRAAGTGLRFNLIPTVPVASDWLTDFQKNPALLRLDLCDPPRACLRGVVEIP